MIIIIIKNLFLTLSVDSLRRCLRAGPVSAHNKIIISKERKENSFNDCGLKGGYFQLRTPIRTDSLGEEVHKQVSNSYAVVRLGEGDGVN